MKLLLDTNGGKYAAACALDFNNTNQLFDTFAVRDSAGYEVMSKSWPFFRSGKSVGAMKANKPVPVRSCWNGMSESLLPLSFVTDNDLHDESKPD